MPRLLILVATVALAGCTVDGPVAAIAPDGEILRGMASSMLIGEEFAVRDEFVVRSRVLECRGQFDPARSAATNGCVNAIVRLT